MVTRSEPNLTLFLCSCCGKVVASYNEVLGYKQLSEFVEVEKGAPECDQPNTHLYYAECAAKGEHRMKTYYHATELSNLDSIVCNGLEPRNIEKLVYLCEKPGDCLKFALVHGVQGEVLVLTVELDDSDVIETFDHSEAFFKCRCWGSTKAIPPSKITEYVKYTIRGNQ